MDRPDIDDIEKRTHWVDQFVSQCTRFDIPELIAYIRELEADKARLDWCEAQGSGFNAEGLNGAFGVFENGGFHDDQYWTASTFREAIDAAMEATKS